MVCHHGHIELILVHVSCEKRYVAQRVVFSLASAAEVGYASVALCHAEARCLGLVVVFLLVHYVQEAGMLLLEAAGQRVAIAYYGFRHSACQDVLHACAVAADEMLGMAEDAEGCGVRWIIAIAQYHSIEG